MIFNKAPLRLFSSAHRSVTPPPPHGGRHEEPLRFSRVTHHRLVCPPFLRSMPVLVADPPPSPFAPWNVLARRGPSWGVCLQSNCNERGITRTALVAKPIISIAGCFFRGGGETLPVRMGEGSAPE